MGVKGLHSLVVDNKRIYLKQVHIHQTHVVFDANNLQQYLFGAALAGTRADIYGGDMITYRKIVERFLDNLAKCKVTPIMVFDGAHDDYIDRSKLSVKLKRSLRKFHVTRKIEVSAADKIMPSLTTLVLKTILIDRNIHIIQSPFEADLDIARVAQFFQCPIASNDSDFLLMNLPHGVIVLEESDFFRVHINNSDWRRSETTYHYFDCHIFMIDQFVTNFTDLPVDNIPLLAILAGNDFVAEVKFSGFCSRLPSRMIKETESRRFCKSPSHEKIIKILYFLQNKTLAQAINAVANDYPKERRDEIKKFIRGNLKAYEIVERNGFEKVLRVKYQQGFRHEHLRLYGKEKCSAMFDEFIPRYAAWISEASERAVCSSVTFEAMFRNHIFIRPHVDDSSLPSAQICRYKPLQVVMRLTAARRDDKKACVVYDRIGRDYGQMSLKPMTHLDNYGPLDHVAYDLPRLAKEVRRMILLATFHSSDRKYHSLVKYYSESLHPEHVRQISVIQVLLNYINRVSEEAKLWREFKDAILVVFLYNIGYDPSLGPSLRRLEQPKPAGKWYKRRVVHQITQLSVSIRFFCELNALLGEVLDVVRCGNWFNGPLIYNLTEELRRRGGLENYCDPQSDIYAMIRNAE